MDFDQGVIFGGSEAVAVGTLTPSYADVVRSTDGRVVSQSKPMTRSTSRTSNVDEEEHY
jgi:hypothetical protein